MGNTPLLVVAQQCFNCKLKSDVVCIMTHLTSYCNKCTNPNLFPTHGACEMIIVELSKGFP